MLSKIEELWHDFFALKHPKQKENLIIIYEPKAVKIGRKLANKHAPLSPIDEIESEARIGLIEAIDKFDPSKNKRIRLIDQCFCIFLWQSIRRSVLQFSRKSSFSSRSQSYTNRLISGYKEEYYKSFGEMPSWKEIENVSISDFEKRKAAGKQKGNYRFVRPDITFINISSPFCKAIQSFEDSSVIENSNEQSHFTDLLYRIFGKNEFNLSLKQIYALKAFYLDHKTNAEIAELLQVKINTVNVLRSEAIHIIRKNLQAKNKEIIL